MREDLPALSSLRQSTCAQFFAAALVAWLLLGSPLALHAQRPTPLPTPLTLEDVLAYGRAHRQEIVAARARARAASARPDIVSALEDPMLMPSVDHLPFEPHGADVSLMIEQSFPLSGVLGHRRRVAEAEAQRFRAEAARVALDVQLDAARAFLMLRERRDVERVLAEQVVLARELAETAAARYASGTGNQPELLRAEIEVARRQSTTRALRLEIIAAESMLNASLGRPVDAIVPDLAPSTLSYEVGTWKEVRTTALRKRPELEVGRSELRSAQAAVDEMDAMYWPMGLLRTGPAYSMSDGWGWMLTLGVSIPLQRDRLAAGVSEARAMVEMARADLAAMTRMLEGEAATARHRVLAARERLLGLRDDVLPRARQAIAPTLAAYSAGTLPLVSVIESAEALWSLQAELVSAEFELDLTWVEFLRAQGQLEEEAR